jgi:hypothetical protein
MDANFIRMCYYVQDIKMDLKRETPCRVEWIQMAQETVKWQAFINIGFLKAANFLTS